ncbi:MAG: UDP-N-acetylmuramate dehydrogenase [Rhodospirillales bacterium]|nr:UDP-N-acetylmuramate dehydrogenase [Rhodospirillales bacterium]
MMAHDRPSPSLIDKLPPVRGQLAVDADLAKMTWFRVGGPAEVLFRPTDEDDLAEFLASMPADVPVTVIGIGSNLLIRDGGVPGVVVRLGDGFTGAASDGNFVDVGGGASNTKAANTARDAGLGGLEFLSGIPGSIGGSVRMNAGAFGSEMSDIVVSVSALDRRGRRREIKAKDMGFSYRHSEADKNLIFVAARLQGSKAAPKDISKRMAEIEAERRTSQPTHTPTGGSTFVNPEGEKAWELIDAAGLRGATRGGAMVSEKHCNFLINTGTATAADLEGLGEEVRRKVFENSGIKLEWEIQRLGVSDGAPLQEVGK